MGIVGRTRYHAGGGRSPGDGLARLMLEPGTYAVTASLGASRAAGTFVLAAGAAAEWRLRLEE